MNKDKNQIFSAERAIEIEKELKEHPERKRVKTITMTTEELYEKIMRNGGSYDIDGGILALKRTVEEEKKKEKNDKKREKEGIW